MFFSEGGIIEFVEMLDKNAGRSPLLPKVIYVDGKDDASNIMVEVALCYNDGYAEHIYSYVNNINTLKEERMYPGQKSTYPCVQELR